MNELLIHGLVHSKTGERIVAIEGELLQGYLALRVHEDRYEYSFNDQEFRAVPWPEGKVIIAALFMREMPLEPIQILLSDLSERLNQS